MALRSTAILCCLGVATSLAASTSTETETSAKEKRMLLYLGDTSKEMTSEQVPTAIQRVVTLLREMKKQLETEMEQDKELYDKMVCWCETNDKEKRKAIKDAEFRIGELETLIEKLAAKKAELEVRIEYQKKKLGEIEMEFNKLTSIRDKENEAFGEKSSELVKAIAMLKNAIIVLSRVHGGFIQFTPAIQESINVAVTAASLQHDELSELDADEALNEDRLTLSNSVDTIKKSVASLLQASNSATASTSSQMADKTILLALRGGSGESSQTALPVEYAMKILEKAASKQPPASMLQQGQAPSAGSYSSQSGQILGILKQMKEDMESDLALERKTEDKAVADYKTITASMKVQIAEWKKNLDAMQAEHAKTTKYLIDAKEELEATNKQLKADKEFLQNLVLICQDLDHQFEQRSKARQAEIKAVNDTIGILTEDDARDLFNKKFGTEEKTNANDGLALLQVDRKRTATEARMRALRTRAADMLLKAADQMRRDPDATSLYQIWQPSAGVQPEQRLSALAVQVQLDAFTKVKAAIDEMIADLKEQQKEEVELKAFCTKELNQNEKDTYVTTEEHDDTVALIEELESTIATLKEEIAAAKDQIAEMQREVKAAGETRAEENAAFQEEVTDQRAVQKILRKAKDRLKQVYKFLQTKQEQAQTPPVQFAPMKKNAGGNVIISFIEQIIEDSKKVEEEAITDENKAQADYEEYVKTADKSIRALLDAIATKTEAMAAAKIDLEAAMGKKGDLETELEDLATNLADLHEQCDFTVKNFDIRQKARMQEMEALANVKAVLSGAK